MPRPARKTAVVGKDGSAQILSGARVVLVIRAIALGGAYLVAVLLARFMGAEEFGRWSFVMGATSLLSVMAALGLPLAVVRFVSEEPAATSGAALRRRLRAAPVLIGLAGILLSCIGTVLLVSKGGMMAGASIPTLAAVFVIGPLLALASWYGGLALAYGAMTRAFAHEALRPVLLLLIVGACWRAGCSRSSDTAFAAVAASLLVILLLQSAWSGRWTGGGLARPDTLRRWLPVSLPLLGIGLCATFIAQMGILVTGWMLGPAEAGPYAAANRLAVLLTIPLGVVNSAAAPRFAAYLARRQFRGLQAMLASLASWFTWPALAMLLVLWAAGGPALAMFGPEFASARLQLGLLGAGWFVNAAAGPVGLLLALSGHERESLRLLAICAVGGGLLTLVLTSRWGSVGSAAGEALTVIAWNVWLTARVMAHLGVHPGATVFFRARSARA